MPNRILKESICASDSIDQLSWFEECVFYRLMVNCDDYGRFDGRVSIIKNRLFPLKEGLKPKIVEQALQKLAAVGLVVLYESDGKPFLYLPTWEKYQTIRNKQSKYPDPNTCKQLNSIEINCNQLNANVPVIQSNTIQSESNTIGRFTPPSVEQVTEYCKERNNNVDPQSFVDFYTAKGWMVGKNKMRDWKAAVRTWEQNRTQQKKRNAALNYQQSEIKKEDWERMVIDLDEQ